MGWGHTSHPLEGSREGVGILPAEGIGHLAHGLSAALQKFRSEGHAVALNPRVRRFPFELIEEPVKVHPADPHSLGDPVHRERLLQAVQHVPPNPEKLLLAARTGASLFTGSLRCQQEQRLS